MHWPKCYAPKMMEYNFHKMHTLSQANAHFKYVSSLCQKRKPFITFTYKICVSTKKTSTMVDFVREYSMSLFHFSPDSWWNGNGNRQESFEFVFLFLFSCTRYNMTICDGLKSLLKLSHNTEPNHFYLYILHAYTYN